MTTTTAVQAASVSSSPEDTLAKQLEKFEALVDRKKDQSELLELFGKLQKSTKIEEVLKPECYLALLKACASRVNDEGLTALVRALVETQAPWIISKKVGYDSVQPVARGLMLRLFRNVDSTQKAVGRLFDAVHFSGLSPHQAETISLLLEAGMSESELDLICDLNWAYVQALIAGKSASST